MWLCEHLYGVNLKLYTLQLPGVTGRHLPDAEIELVEEMDKVLRAETVEDGQLGQDLQLVKATSYSVQDTVSKVI